MKDQNFFLLVGIIAGAILGFLRLPLALKIGTYIGLAVILTGFLFMMYWFDKKLVELKK